jgi:hypothetical protein
VGFIDQQDNASTTFVLPGREQVLRLGHQAQLLKPRGAAPRARTIVTYRPRMPTVGLATYTTVRRLVQSVHGGTHRDGPISPVITPSNDSAMQNRMHAMASVASAKPKPRWNTQERRGRLPVK